MSIKTFIIIPARSGSKGIRDKNIKLLGGKPLINWTAECVQAAKLENSLCIMSTDSERYAELGRQAGLNVPFIRPDSLALDKTSSLDVAKHALQWFSDTYHYLPEQVMLLQPTSPFRSSTLLETAVDMMQSQQADGVIGCKEIHRDLSTLYKLEDNFLSPLAANQITQTRRQDIKPLLTPNGALYLCKTEIILNNDSVYGPHTLPLVMNAILSIDIDDMTDWDMAEAILSAHLGQFA